MLRIANYDNFSSTHNTQKRVIMIFFEKGGCNQNLLTFRLYLPINQTGFNALPPTQLY